MPTAASRLARSRSMRQFSLYGSLVLIVTCSVTRFTASAQHTTTYDLNEYLVVSCLLSAAGVASGRWDATWVSIVRRSTPNTANPSSSRISDAPRLPGPSNILLYDRD